MLICNCRRISSDDQVINLSGLFAYRTGDLDHFSRHDMEYLGGLAELGDHRIQQSHRQQHTPQRSQLAQSIAPGLRLRLGHA